MGLPDITVQQLEYLDAVDRNTTWAVAASSLGVSPSALSQGLAELERRVGLTLFERHGRRRIPTDDCTVVLEHARRVLAQTHDLVDWAADRRHGRTGRVRVGMIDAAAVDRYPDLLRRFRDEHPEVELNLRVAPSEDLLAQLRHGELDLAVCVQPRDPVADLLAEVVAAEPMRLYAPDGVRAGPPATWGPWVTFPAGSHTRALIAAAVREAGARFEVVADSHQPEVLREMVRLGLGWTVLPVSQAERAPSPLRPARRQALASRTLALFRRRDAVGSAAVDHLAQQLMSGARRVRPPGSMRSG